MPLFGPLDIFVNYYTHKPDPHIDWNSQNPANPSWFFLVDLWTKFDKLGNPKALLG